MLLWAVGDFFFFWTLRGVERTVLRTLCLNFFRPKDIEGLYTLKMPVLWGSIYKNPHFYYGQKWGKKGVKMVKNEELIVIFVWMASKRTFL